MTMKIRFSAVSARLMKATWTSLFPQRARSPAQNQRRSLTRSEPGAVAMSWPRLNLVDEAVPRAVATGSHLTKVAETYSLWIFASHPHRLKEPLIKRAASLRWTEIGSTLLKSRRDEIFVARERL